MMSQTEADLILENRDLRAKLEAAERERDLVRYARHFLHEEGLISDEELGALIADSENGQRVARLESYDAVRGKAATHDIVKATCERRGKERDQLREQLERLTSPPDQNESWKSVLIAAQQLGNGIAEPVYHITADYNRMRDEVTQLREQRDALAAALRLETMCPSCDGTKEVTDECFVCLTGEPGKCECRPMTCPQCAGNGWDCKDDVRSVVGSLHSGHDPEAILADHDREVRRKALEEAAGQFQMSAESMRGLGMNALADSDERGASILRRMAEEQK